MSEMRKDPIVGRWVIMAPSRADRPNAFVRTAASDPAASCPFCEGHEQETPSEVLAYREPGAQRDGPGWRVRVVPNKYPALDLHGTAERRTDGIYDTIPGVGAHEVIIESPQHLARTSELSVEQLAEVFAAYRQRLVHWKQDPRLAYGMVFKNVGVEAGASLEHTHSQLIVTPIVPIDVCEELSGALEFYERRGRCVYCEMICRELSDGVRVVQETPNFLALSPFAARFAFETWVLPKTHSSHYESAREDGMIELAALMKQVLTKIEAALDRPAYNYILHTAPFDTADVSHYHWHIEVIPSLTKPAGFEWGSGFFINPVPPEDATAFLRASRWTKG